MSDVRNVRLVLSPIPSESVIEVDGAKLTGVRHVSLDASAGEIPTLELELEPIKTTTFEGKARVLIPSSVREDLIALGWIPTRAVKAIIWTDPGTGQVCHLHPGDVQIQTYP